MATTKWRDLSERTRKRLLALAIAEGSLKAAALVDLKRRPAGEVRGPKWRWALALTFVNSFGAMPVAYFLFGRHKD